MGEVTAIGGWGDTSSGNAVYPWPQPNGYTCVRCGAWVLTGSYHYCPVQTTIIQGVTVSDHELDQLGKVVKALEDARTCFSNLKEKDEANRVIAYLSHRFGIKEGVLIDVLVEDD